MNIGWLLWWRRVSVSPAAAVDGPGATMRRRLLLQRLVGPIAVLVGVPVLVLGLTVGTAAASGAGVVTNYISPSISQPDVIATGPDGALWFTNFGNNSIGRITTAGKVTNYTGTGISNPWVITAAPDGALWFVNYSNKSIGRITTTVTPKIGSFTPHSGPVGATVTITGQNLSGATKVKFNGTPATIVSDTATQIVTHVPAGATTGHLSVTTPAGTATSSGTFTVT
jgi:hypothetical protein